MFVSRLTPALQDAGILDAARGSWAEPTIIHCKDRRVPRYLTSDAFSGDRLRLDHRSADLDALEIGDTLMINGTDHDLVERRMIAHQGPVFVLGTDQAMLKAKAQRLLLHDTLNGRDHDVDLCGTTLAKLDAGDRIRVDGALQVVSGRLSDSHGETIFSVPLGTALMNWAFRSAVMLRFAPRHSPPPLTARADMGLTPAT